MTNTKQKRTALRTAEPATPEPPIRATAALSGGPELRVDIGVRAALAGNEATHARWKEVRLREFLLALAAGGYMVTPTAGGALTVEDSRGQAIAVVRVLP